MERISKENYYLNITETVLERSTCLRRLYGAIIVKMMRLSRPVTTVLPGAVPTAQTWATAPGRP